MGLLSSSNKSSNKQTSKPSKKNTAAQTIPFKALYSDGIMEVKQGTFSKTYKLEDVNFKTASQNDQDSIFIKYGDFLNMFGSEVSCEVSVYSKCVDAAITEDEVAIKLQGDKLDRLRDELTGIILSKMAEGKNNLVLEKYVTVSFKAESYDKACSEFTRLEGDMFAAIKAIDGASITPLGYEERMNLLYGLFNPMEDVNLTEEKEIKGHKVKALSMSSLAQQGITNQDVLAPTYFEFKTDSIRLGEHFAQCLYLQQLPSFLSTDFMDEISSLPFNMITSVHYESFRQEKAMRLIKNKIVNIDADVINLQKKATRAGYSADLISPDVIHAKEQANKILNDMSNRNQKLFNTTFVITHFANDEETLKAQCDTIMATARKYLVQIRKLLFQQEQGFETSLPIGSKALFIERTLTTEAASIFIPFSVQELHHKNGFYYGLNAISKNLILYDRTLSNNSNGIILGTPGSGKSFAAKREIFNVLLSTDADVFVIDPEREYAPLADAVNGEVVRLAAGSDVHINPLDMDIEYADKDDPVTLKSDYICSLMETIAGGKYGLSTIHKSIIDRCVRSLYIPYINYMTAHPELGTSCPAKAPTLTNLYELIKNQPEPEAQSLAVSLERYSIGSLDTFAKRTNVDINNRFVVYDIKDIGSGMDELGVQVCLNDIWNRTIENARKGKSTWFYIDEFYLLMKNESSASFIQQIFKRARKWHGVPTGITQNVEDLLITNQARTILANCDFVMMLKQAPTDKADLQKMFNISKTQLKYITNSEAGQGILYTGSTIVPFIDRYPTDTETYKVMTTKPKESQKL